MFFTTTARVSVAERKCDDWVQEHRHTPDAQKRKGAKKGRKEGRKVGRMEGREEGSKEGMKEGRLKS